MTINGDYNPIIGNFDANTPGVDMTDIFWYGPGSSADSVWMNNGKTFTTRAATVNGYYSPMVVPSRESTTQDDIFWDSKTAGDFLWVTNGTSTAFSYTSMTPSAWGGTDIGTRDGIAGDFNAADPTASALYYDSISSGGSFSCAMTSSGGVKCWGLNSSGQLGNGTTTNSSIPVNVTSATSNMFSVAAGNAHACAVTTGQAAVCWGYNANGQLGNGTTTNSTTPVAVSSLGTTVSEVSASEFHSCALINGGTVKCWGANQYGQLGNGTTTNSLTPVTVTGLSSVTQIDAGLSSLTCAVSAGAAKCWGLNGSGQLGNGNTTNQSSPVTVTGLGSGVAKVGAGSSHACALTAAGAVKCWGANDSGQLGNGTNTPSTTPVAVTGLTSGVSDLTVGQSTNCATLSTGVVKCWGANTPTARPARPGLDRRAHPHHGGRPQRHRQLALGGGQPDSRAHEPRPDPVRRPGHQQPGRWYSPPRRAPSSRWRAAGPSAPSPGLPATPTSSGTRPAAPASRSCSGTVFDSLS
ncbi:MAG: hypothetical protein U0P45_02945 [Acidimicrobiales bacterium]